MSSTKRFFRKYLLSSMGILLFFVVMNIVFWAEISQTDSKGT